MKPVAKRYTVEMPGVGRGMDAAAAPVAQVGVEQVEKRLYITSLTGPYSLQFSLAAVMP
jgi:hypothetical protein